MVEMRMLGGYVEAELVAARTGDARTLKINEWLANGVTPFPDDFIELFNPDPLPVALGDLFLTEVVSKGKILYEANHRGMGAKGRRRSPPGKAGQGKRRSSA